MKTVKFNETTLFEGVRYEKDRVYDLPDKAVYALGSSVGVLEDLSPREESRSFEAPPVDKMIKKAPKSKNV
jgi:hypothetical protein